MAETVRIEIPIETIDNTDPELSNVIKNFERVEQAAEQANNSTRKAGNTVSQFDKNAEKTQKSLAKWAKEKYEVLLEAKEKISPVLNTIGTGLRNFTSRTWSVSMKAIDLVTSPVRGIINLLRNPIFQVGAVLGVSIGLADTVNTYKDFEAAMSQVQAISGATGSELESLTEKAKEMGATTKFTAKESAEAFNYMAMAGWKTQDMISGIEGILNLAAASGEELATTSDIVTDALTAFKMQASDSGHFADVLAAAASNANTTVSGMGETFKYAGAMAGTLGYSIEDVALATGLMANSGIKGTMAGTALNSIFTRLSTNTNGATDAIRELGIEFFDKSGNARDLSDVMEELRAATADYTDEQKSNIANTIAGTVAQKGLLSILNASAEDYKKLSEAINNADGSAKEMSETMLDNLSGSITLLQSAVDGVKISFGNRLSPYVRSIAEWLTAQMPEIEQGLEEFMDWFDKKIDRMQIKFNEIASMQEWQDADFFGKVKIAWDEFIAEPFSEWWRTTGKAKFANFAQDIGTGLGTGLKFGIMTMLGIDISETVDEGVSIGASFAKGFSEGFDFDAISEKLWQGFSNLLSNAGKLLPGGEAADLSSILSLMMLSRIATPFISMGRGMTSIAKGLFGTNAATGNSVMGSLLGSSTTGSGLLGNSALLAIDLGAGNLAGGASMSTGALAATGLAAGAGAVVGGATLISGAMDAYKAISSDNTEEKAAYGESAAWKAAGVATGAAAGAALGSVIPGIGTVVGSLVGGGIGGIVGWFKGDSVKDEYQEKVEEMQREAEKAQKVFQATGLSIDDVTFKNKELIKAMNDTEVSAEQFALMFQEECANVMDEAFGDIELSLTEIKKLAEEITFAGMKESIEEFNTVTASTESSLLSLKNSVTELKKANWHVSLGMELSETEQNSYKKDIENFIDAAQTYIDDNHYQATVALNLLTNGNGAAAGIDNMYQTMKNQIDEISKQLSNEIEIALKDGVITLDESSEIINLQNQITDITNKLTEAQAEAQIQAIGMKFKASGAELDEESFLSLQEELQAKVAEIEESYDSALTVTLANLNLRKDNDEDFTQEDYEKAVDKAYEDYYAHISELNNRVEQFNLNTIANAYAESLDGILPDFEGTVAEKLEQAMNNALLINPEPKEWKDEDIIKWFNLEGIDTTVQDNLKVLLKNTASAIPENSKEQILQSFVNSIPTAEEIYNAIDWSSVNYYDLIRYSKPRVEVNPDDYANQADFANALKLAEQKNISQFAGIYSEDNEVAEETKRAFAESIHDKLETMLNPDTVREFVNSYMTEVATETMTGASNVIYQQDYSLTTDLANSIKEKTSLIREAAESAVTEAYSETFEVTANINVIPIVSLTGASQKVNLAGALPYGELADTASNHAGGGYVSGGPQLSWLAEEGYGEFIIPTNPSRRSRALELYEQAGKVLGVSRHAEGGYTGGVFDAYSVLNADNLNSISEAISNAPRAYNETTDTNYETVSPVYSAGSESSEHNMTGTSIQVSVHMTPEFNITGDGQSEDDIMAVIRRHMREMADELGGEIAEKIEEVFSNMPLKEA